jgi:signal transduction histidine kinase
MLDYSKLEVEGISVRKSVFNLRALIEQIHTIMRFNAKTWNVNSAFQIDARIKDLAEGDAARIRQVLLNLLTNAVKFSSKKEGSGNVTLNIKHKQYRFGTNPF